MVIFVLCIFCVKLRKYCVSGFTASGSVLLCFMQCCTIFLEVYDFFSIVSIVDLAHVDAKETYRSSSEIGDLVIVKLDATLLALPILSQGVETWFQHPPILLRVRL